MMFYKIILTTALFSACALGQDDAFRWPGGAKAAVALTYDDGVDADLDHAIPDLDARNLRATFYVPGSSASLSKRMEEWRTAARRGHELGNHTLFHPCLTRIPGEERTWVTPDYTAYRMPRVQMRGEKSAPQARGAGTMADWAYEILKRAIMRGELGEGSFISEKEVTERYAISRTPFREACNRLQHEEFLE